MQKSGSTTSITFTSGLTACFDVEVVGPWVCEGLGYAWKPFRNSGIGKMVGGVLVAGVLYEDFNGANVFCHIRGSGRWACPAFLGLIFDYPFKQIKAKRITVTVDDDNVNSIRLVEKMGFALESRMKQANPRGGDVLVYRMFKDDCKYLRGRYAAFAGNPRT